MSPSEVFAESYEVRNAAGQVIGYFVPAGQFTACPTNRQQPVGGASLPPQVEKHCQRLMNERNELLEEVAELRAKRDEYKKEIYTLLPLPDIVFTNEELREIERDGVTFDQILEDLEKIMGS